MLNSLKPLMGGSEEGAGDKFTQITTKIEEFKGTIDEVNRQFKNHAQTTFVAVCIPEFLSMYETERLCSELCNFDIDI